MVVISKYLHCVQKNTALKYIKRGYVSISNCCETFQDHENTVRKMSTSSDVCLSTDDSVESSDLKNGIRLVCESRSSYTTTVGCFFPAGAMYEMPEERGSSLFLEHLLFRRTRRKSQEELMKAFEGIGARVTAITARDMFLFYGTVPSRGTAKLINLFADVIMNNVIQDQDVTREKCIILRELSTIEADREKVAMDYLPTIAYQGTGLENSVYPETDVVKTFSKETLTEFQNRLFKPYSMTLVCTGPIRLQELERIVCSSFISDSEVHEKAQLCTEREFRFSGTEVRLRDDDDELGYVAVGVEGPGSKQCGDYYALNVAKEIVGSWDRSYSGANHNAPYIAHGAFNTDLCHMYKSFFQNWAQTTSIWGCYFVCDKMCLETMTKVLQAEWMRLCTTINQKEVSRAVNQCKMKELMLLNDPVSRFFDIVRHFFRYGYYIPIQQRITEYEKITADRIRETCVRYIYDQSPAVVALGRIENLQDYVVIKNGMYLLRY